ncbi:hypothetical protein [Staphylococcus aureus]|uniref:hypothetical protein n=1 Tax=Staphylococcus aureus TaxID=1280 RepID=UPI000B3038FE
MNYETGFQLGVMDARLKKMRKQRDEYKKQRDELIGDIGKLRENNVMSTRSNEMSLLGI